jgi:ATP-dependent Zn protease
LNIRESMPVAVGGVLLGVSSVSLTGDVFVGLLVACTLVFVLWSSVDTIARRRAASVPVVGRPPDPVVGRPPGPVPFTVDRFQDDTACHEAGHVLFAWLSVHVAEVGSVEVDAPLGYSGRVRYKTFPMPEVYLLWFEVVMSLAGLAGTAIVYGRFRSGGARLDLEQARASAEAIVDAGVQPPAWAVAEPSSIDFASMYRTPMRPEVARVLCTGFAVARRLLLAESVRFDDLRVEILRRRRLGPDDLARILGPRPIQAMPYRPVSAPSPA